jgi:hypothetical protein
MSERVYLRPVREGDMPAVHGWWNDKFEKEIPGTPRPGPERG